MLVRILSSSPEIARALVHDAQDLAMPPADRRVAIWTNVMGCWRLVTRMEPRALDSVILEDGVLEDLRADVVRFLGRGEVYRDRGIPYRRGYLLHGIPGSGKTSAIMALAGSFGMDLYALSLASRGMTDAVLVDLLLAVPPKAIVLLEDVDAAFDGRTKAKSSESLSFSGLLNALDGAAAAAEGRIMFLTTNHLERLDPALIRPGRVDRRVEFRKATPRQAGRMYARFFPAAPAKDVGAFKGLYGDGTWSMAEIQDKLLELDQEFDERERLMVAGD